MVSYDNWLERGITWDIEGANDCDCCEPGCERCEDYMNILFDVERSSIHTARKNHLDHNGKVIVKKGKRYRYNYRRTVWQPEGEEKQTEVTISKHELRF